MRHIQELFRHIQAYLESCVMLIYLIYLLIYSNKLAYLQLITVLVYRSSPPKSWARLLQLLVKTLKKLPLFWKEPGRTRGWNQNYFMKLLHLWNSFLVRVTVVNQTLLGHTGSSIGRNFPRLEIAKCKNNFSWRVSIFYHMMPNSMNLATSQVSFLRQ